jgi:K+-transporting ATPase KdpF subunit
MKKLKALLIPFILGSDAFAQKSNATTQNQPGYTLAAIISLMILCYLLYALFKPEKF